MGTACGEKHVASNTKTVFLEVLCLAFSATGLREGPAANRGLNHNMLKLISKILDQPAAPQPVPGAPKEPTGTRLASSASRVRGLLKEIGAQRVLVHGDPAGFASAKAALDSLELTWASNELDDVTAGAAHVEDIDWHNFDAAVVVGSNLPRRYRQAMRLMAACDATRPVLWIGAGFEFCGGTLSAPAGMTEVEGLLFNHFDAFFGVKDALQYRIEIYHGPEVKRYFRILHPNQSHIIRLSDHFPETRYPVSLAAFVEHPVLTRDRHYRLRLVGDVFWKDSLTTLHSAHEFNRSPDHDVEFRLPAWLVREGEVALTLPNYDHHAPSGSILESLVGSASTKAPRDSQQFIEQSTLARDGLAPDAFFGWRYKGFGGSNWFVLENGGVLAAGRQGNIAGNHHVSCPVLEKNRRPADPEEQARYERLERDGFVLEAHPVPLTDESSDLVYGFEADAANPRQRLYRIDFFDADGAHMGRVDYEKQTPGPLFPQELAPDKGAKLALVSNDWRKAGLRFKGLKPMANLIAYHRRTGDQDFTEFQSCWRNLGTAVPGFPHWLTDDLAVIGRTNVFGRARCDAGLRTGVMIVNASGRLAYRTTAETTLTVFNNRGVPASGAVSVPAFSWRMVWLDELIPNLEEHLGAAANGALLIRSGDADLNCQLVTLTPQGAVSLQHLWGY